MRRAARVDSTREAVYVVSERDFARTVIDLAKVYRWKIYHTYLSIRSEPGFPDLVLVRPPRIIFAELKTERGKVSQAQDDWLFALSECSGAECYIWRPSDWENIVATLEAR